MKLRKTLETIITALGILMVGGIGFVVGLIVTSLRVAADDTVRFMWTGALIRLTNELTLNQVLGFGVGIALAAPVVFVAAFCILFPALNKLWNRWIKWPIKARAVYKAITSVQSLYLPQFKESIEHHDWDQVFVKAQECFDALCTLDTREDAHVR